MKVFRFFLLWLIFIGAAPAQPETPLRPASEPIQPLEAPHEDAALVALGERLFSDVRLSGNDTVSCAHCHPLAIGGADRLPRSVGMAGRQGLFNAPTVYDTAGYLAYFWNGRAPSLEALIRHGPLQTFHEMDSSWPAVVAKLRRDADLVGDFGRVFPDGLTADNLVTALAAFVRSLVTLDAPFDRWLRGDEKALSERQLRGYRLFKSRGCISCHQGRAVGGNLFAPLGVMGDYFADHGGDPRADAGRQAVTGREEDRHLFRVPSLRLAALTAPYFHDGQVKTLEEAVRLMGRYQLGRELPAAEVEAIVAFLRSLVGRHPALEVEVP